MSICAATLLAYIIVGRWCLLVILDLVCLSIYRRTDGYRGAIVSYVRRVLCGAYETGLAIIIMTTRECE